MPRKRWSEETKAAAMADLASGATVKEVAAKYGMPLSTAGDMSPGSKQGALKIRKISDLQQLQSQFQELLAYHLGAQKNILGQTYDAEWMARQSATELDSLLQTSFRQGGKLLGALFGPPAATLDADPQDAPSETD